MSPCFLRLGESPAYSDDIGQESSVCSNSIDVFIESDVSLLLGKKKVTMTEQVCKIQIQG